MTMAAAALLTMGSTQAARAQGYRYNSEHRRPVQATIHDLQEVAEHNPAFRERERERYDNAIRHLSQFSERLHEGGYFDKDKLDQAIADVQHLADHNPIDERGREILFRDLRELRRLREHFDERYRYPY
jgi:hypothetical protein